MNSTNVEDYHYLIGFSLEDAYDILKHKNINIEIRPERIDGVSQLMYMNFSFRRLNVYINNGKISKLKSFG